MQLDQNWNRLAVGAVTDNTTVKLCELTIPADMARRWLWVGNHGFHEPAATDSWFTESQVRFFLRENEVARLQFVFGTRYNSINARPVPYLPVGGALPALSFGDVRFPESNAAVEVSGFDLPSILADRVELWRIRYSADAAMNLVYGLAVWSFPR